MDQKYKPPPAIPETVICGVLTDTIATGSTGGLSWEGHGCSNLLHKWAGEPVAHRPLRPGLPDRQKRVPDRARPLGSPSQTTLQRFVSVPSRGRLSQSKAGVQPVNATAYATRYHSDWFGRGAQHVRKWRRSH